MSKIDPEVLRRVRVRVGLRKGQTRYMEDSGFDYQRYFDEENMDQNFMQDYQKYLAEETEVVCDFKGITDLGDGKAKIRIEVSSLDNSVTENVFINLEGFKYA